MVSSAVGWLKASDYPVHSSSLVVEGCSVPVVQVVVVLRMLSLGDLLKAADYSVHSSSLVVEGYSIPVVWVVVVVVVNMPTSDG